MQTICPHETQKFLTDHTRAAKKSILTALKWSFLSPNSL